MSTLETGDDVVVESSQPRPVLAIVALATGIGAVVVNASTFFLPSLAGLAGAEGWDLFGLGIVGLLGAAILAGILATVAAITGGIALLRSDGRARAGAGLAFGLAVLVSVLENAIVMASIAAMIPASISTF